MQVRVPFELTAAGMLERVAVVVERLDTCDERVKWPPRGELRVEKGKGQWTLFFGG